MFNDLGEHSRHVLARLGRNEHSALGIQLERVVHLLEHAGDISVREVDLVQYWNQSQSLREGQIEVGHCLRLHALTGINEDEGATAAGIAPGHLGAEVDVAGGINQMQQIVITVVVVDHGACLGLDRDASLPLHVQLVEDLLVATGLNRTRQLQQPVREGAFAMVHVSDNAKVAVALDGDVGDALLEVGLSAESLGVGAGERREALKAGGRANGAGVPTAQQAARGPDA